MAIARWEPPNQPSLSFNERVAFAGLSAFLSGNDWQRFSVFGSGAEGVEAFGFTLASPGDHFISTGVNDTGVSSYWVFGSSTQSWMVWDFEQWSYNPASSGLTIGNGTEKALVLREGRYVNIQYRLLWGSTTSATGGWTATWETPTTTNSPLNYDLVARFDSFGGAVAYPSEFNHHSFAEITDASPLAAVDAGVRMESSALWRMVTKPTVVVGGVTYLTYGGITSTGPWTWTTNDQMYAEFRYVFDS